MNVKVKDNKRIRRELGGEWIIANEYFILCCKLIEEAMQIEKRVSPQNTRCFIQYNSIPTLEGNNNNNKERQIKEESVGMV